MGIIVKILILLGLIFLFSMFFLSRLFIPNLGFKREKVPKNIPSEFSKAIIKLKKMSKNKKDFAIKSYKYLSKKFHGEPGRVWHDFNELFINNINELWKKRVLHCHQINYLYRTALIKSKLFKENDIKIVHTFAFFNIHQFLEINLGRLKEEWVKVDMWAKNVGYGFGKTLPNFFIPFDYWKKRKTSPFSFWSVFSYIFKRIF